MEKLRKYYLPILIGLITILGFEIRFAISNCPLWYDEGHSILVAIQHFPFGIDNFLFTKDFQHTPFYFYFLHFWIKVFGTTEIMLRMSSVIFGILCIPLVYIVTKKLYNDKIAGIIASILTAVSPLLVYYSIEIRMYAMVTFFALLSTNYLLDYDVKKDKKSLRKLLVTNTLIPYLLIGGIVFNIGQAISYSVYLFLTQKNEIAKIKEYFTYRVYQIILLIPYFCIAVYYAYQRSKFIMFHIPPFQFCNFVGNIQNFFGANVGMLFWTNFMPFMIDFIFFMAVVLPSIYFINALIKAFKENNAKIYMIFSTIIIAYSIILISCFLQIIVLVPRYIIFIVPLLFILASIGFSKLKKWHIVLFLAVFTGFSMYYIFEKTDYYNTKYFALLDSNNYFQKIGLTSEDRVYRPFASSVAFIYYYPNGPICPPFEVLHEFRKPDNTLVYDDEQIQQFKNGKVDEFLYNKLRSNDYISKKYYNFLKTTFIDAVKSGRYIVFAVYGPDNQALVPLEEQLKRFPDIKSVHDDRVLAFLYKLLRDTINIFSEYCDLVDKQQINDHTYFVFKKK